MEWGWGRDTQEGGSTKGHEEMFSNDGHALSSTVAVGSQVNTFIVDGTKLTMPFIIFPLCFNKAALKTKKTQYD